MKQAGLIALCLAGAFCATVLAAEWVESWLRGPLCSNTVLAEIKSPTGELMAVVFVRDCGATTDYTPKSRCWTPMNVSETKAGISSSRTATRVRHQERSAPGFGFGGSHRRNS